MGNETEWSQSWKIKTESTWASSATEMLGKENLDACHARGLGSSLKFKGRTREFKIEVGEY